MGSRCNGDGRGGFEGVDHSVGNYKYETISPAL